MGLLCRSLFCIFTSSKVILRSRCLSSSTIKVDPAPIEHLERLSLVDFANASGVRRLEAAISLAEQIAHVDTTGVTPFVSVPHEHSSLHVRDDVVTEGGDRCRVLRNAVETDEEYFVAPPGNIPLSKRSSEYSEDQ